MKKFLLLITCIMTMSNLSAQEKIEVNKKNSWIKAGLTAGVPIGDTSDFTSFRLGADIRGQYMLSPNFGIGLTSGYNHYFAKDDFEDFGTIPVAAFVRYYPKSKGLFLGVDGGYSFITNIENEDGGLYINPHVGYHNADWNFFGFYQHTFLDNSDIQSVGIGATYNIKFK